MDSTTNMTLTKPLKRETDFITETTPNITNIDGSNENVSEIDLYDLTIHQMCSYIPSSSQPQIPKTSMAEVQLSHSSTPKASSDVTSTDMLEHCFYKNRLQEFTQKFTIPFPIYQTLHVGTQHMPRFRSTVSVNGQIFTSHVSFPNRKAAEQDVARLALQSLTGLTKDKDVDSPLVLEDTKFSKSIMNEYATKLNVAMPTYSTAHIMGELPVFVSTLVFNGTKYTGDACTNKKGAEQRAAYRAILSLLDDPASETLCKIVKSKSKLTATIKPITSATIANRGQGSEDLNIGGAGSEQSLGEASLQESAHLYKKARLGAA